MAVSEVTIINDALALLGEPRINSRSDNTPQGKAADRLFDSTKETFLSMHFWRFATKYVELGQNVTAPPFKYGYSFALPADFVRLVELNETDVGNVEEPLFERVGDNLYTDETSAKIAYIYDADVNIFDSSAARALAYLLAIDMSRLLVDSATQREEVNRGFDKWFKRAKAIDSMHQRQPLPNKDHYSGFIQAHIGSSNWYPTPTTS